MIDEEVARLNTHRKNIDTYRRLLRTNLSDIERQFIERRLKEEVAAVYLLTDRTDAVSPGTC
jgi:hypothetical protein